MRLLVLGGTRFLGRHVAEAALARGHDVATFTRGVSGAPPECARALHGDRDDPAALPKALDGWEPELVVDTSGQTRAAARNAADELADVRAYAYVSSLNAYRNWPPGPVGPEDGEPTWDTDEDEYGPIRAASERILGAALGDRFLPPAPASSSALTTRSTGSAGGWTGSHRVGASSSPRASSSRSPPSTPVTSVGGWSTPWSAVCRGPSTPPGPPA
jgi:NAD(P)-dependent dehydrogenase (short-subunit alcohol dehydrogenase family)